MIFGHWGLAAGVRGQWTRTSLPWLLVAAVAPDGWDLLMAVAGVCNPSGLYSHTVPAVALTAAMMGGAAFLASSKPGFWRAALPTALACVAVVLLHPALDFFTGRKLFWPGGELHGLGWYDRPWVDFLLEGSLTVGGWLLLRRSRAAPRWATAPATLCGVLLLQGLVNVNTDPSQRRLNKPTACAVADTVPR